MKDEKDSILRSLSLRILHSLTFKSLFGQMWVWERIRMYGSMWYLEKTQRCTRKKWKRRMRKRRL